jgi:hypothetical protein
VALVRRVQTRFDGPGGRSAIGDRQRLGLVGVADVKQPRAASRTHRKLIRLFHSALPGYGPERVDHPAITAGFSSAIGAPVSPVRAGQRPAAVAAVRAPSPGIFAGGLYGALPDVGTG